MKVFNAGRYQQICYHPTLVKRRMFSIMVVAFCFFVSACGGSSDEQEIVPDSSSSAPSAPSAPSTLQSNNQGSGSHAGHTACMVPDYVSDALVTAEATQSGNWSEPSTWNGILPENGDIVKIPQGIEVTIASMLAPRLKSVRIDGSLKFAHNTFTELKVDTIFSSCSGLLQIGSASSPVDANVKAKILFIDEGEITDQNMVTRGAVLMGRTVIYGAAKTHRAIITPQARQGDNTLTLDLAPIGWRIDDQLVITGTIANDPTSDEIRTITQINGNQISLNRPLDIDHIAPTADLNVYVANTTRNVEFVSENTQTLRRGHIMFMHTLDVDIQNARFTELGRTDKTRPLNDFRFDFNDGGAGDDAPDEAELVLLGGDNIRGRYSLHFHLGGTESGKTPVLVKGSVVFNGPGWGFVNHSSNVDFIDNIAYGLQGAGFYTEAGDEIGSMRGNIAIRSVNSTFVLDDQGAIDPDLSADHMDYGNDGDGFWLTGNRVSLINNVSSGASAHGFIYWTDGIMEPNSNPATRVTVKVSDIENGNLIPGRESIPVWWAPFAESRGNESYGATVGFRIRYVHAKNYLGRDEQSDFHRSPPQAYIDTLSPTVSDLTVWGSRDGVLLNYNERMNLTGARIVGFGPDISRFSFNPGTAKSGIGLDVGNDATHGPANIQNVTIEGFGMGMATPVNGQWQLENLSLRNNGTDLLIQLPETEPTEVFFRNVSYESFQVDDEESDQLPDHIRVVN